MFNAFGETRIAKFFFHVKRRKLLIKIKQNERFIYNYTDKHEPKRKRIKNKRFVAVRMAKFFFMTLNFRQFQRISRKAMGQLGSYGSNLLLLLEARLNSFVYRAGFFYSTYRATYFIKLGIFAHDRKIISYSNSTVGVGSMVTVIPEFHFYIRYVNYRRYQETNLLFAHPKYMYVLSFLFCAYMERRPIKQDMVYPITIDIARMANFAH